MFDFNDVISCAEKLPITKRSILKVISMFFDPMDLICPIVLQAKLLFKRICFIKSGWDDEVSPDIVAE